MASGWRCSKHLVFAPAAKGTNTCSIFERELNNFATLPRPTMGPSFFFFFFAEYTTAMDSDTIC